MKAKNKQITESHKLPSQNSTNNDLGNPNPDKPKKSKIKPRLGRISKDNHYHDKLINELHSELKRRSSNSRSSEYQKKSKQLSRETRKNDDTSHKKDSDDNSRDISKEKNTHSSTKKGPFLR